MFERVKSSGDEIKSIRDEFASNIGNLTEILLKSEFKIDTDGGASPHIISVYDDPTMPLERRESWYKRFPPNYRGQIYGRIDYLSDDSDSVHVSFLKGETVSSSERSIFVPFHAIRGYTIFKSKLSKSV